jgi:uncharacterized protein
MKVKQLNQLNSQQKIIALWALFLFGIVFHVQLGVMPIFYGQSVTMSNSHGIAPQQDLWLMLGFYLLPMLAMLGTLLTESRLFRVAHFGLTLFYSVINVLHVGFDLTVSPIEWYQILLVSVVFISGIFLNFAALDWVKESYKASIENKPVLALIEAMKHEDFYPHPASSIQYLQTHISHVFLAGDYAYKIKKELDLGFLNYSTLGKRKYYCEQELQLNRRLAPQLYLDVKAVINTPKGFQLAERTVEDVVEYCVQMRQFDQDQLFSRLLERGELTLAHVEQLGKLVADFHRDIQPCSRSLDQIRSMVNDTYKASQKYLGSLLDPALYDRVCTFSEHLFTTQSEYFLDRLMQGRIKQCHGDMHLNNIVLFDQKITIFDCIEFNENLSCTDVMAEIAFPVMDLEANGRSDLANRLLNTYLEQGGDWEGVAWLPLYLCYRAFVRGWVHAQSSENLGLTTQEQKQATDRARNYFQWAQRYASLPPGQLYMTHGPSGSGKTTKARQICLDKQAIHLRSDAVRKHLAGIPVDHHQPAPSGEGIYSREMSDRTYTKMLSLAEVCLRAGFSVVLDACYPHYGQRHQVIALSSRLDVPVSIIECDCSREVLEQRLRARADDISDASIELLESQLKGFEPLREDEQKYAQYRSSIFSKS